MARFSLNSFFSLARFVSFSCRWPQFFFVDERERERKKTTTTTKKRKESEFCVRCGEGWPQGVAVGGPGVAVGGGHRPLQVGAAPGCVCVCCVCVCVCVCV